MKASPHAEDAPILLPGEWEVNTREERLEHGIPLDAGSWQAICEAALQIGMPDAVLQEFRQRLNTKQKARPVADGQTKGNKQGQ